MQRLEQIMAKTAVVNIRVPEALKGRLKALATSTKRSQSHLVIEALERYVDENAWQVEKVKGALAASQQPEARFVSHDEAMEWFDSLGTERPLQKPAGRRFTDLS